MNDLTIKLLKDAIACYPKQAKKMLDCDQYSMSFVMGVEALYSRHMEEIYIVPHHLRLRRLWHKLHPEHFSEDEPADPDGWYIKMEYEDIDTMLSEVIMRLYERWTNDHPELELEHDYTAWRELIKVETQPAQMELL